MSVIITLFAAGVLLLAFEVIVPGAILGIIGTVMILIGVVVSFGQYGMNGGLIATATALGLTGLTLYLEFVLLPKSRVARKLSLTDTVAARRGRRRRPGRRRHCPRRRARGSPTSP